MRHLLHQRDVPEAVLIRLLVHKLVVLRWIQKQEVRGHQGRWSVSVCVCVCVCACMCACACVRVHVCSHRGLLQAVQEVMMVHVEVGVSLTHQRLSSFLGRLQDTNTNHMSIK